MTRLANHLCKILSIAAGTILVAAGSIHIPIGHEHSGVALPAVHSSGRAALALHWAQPRGPAGGVHELLPAAEAQLAAAIASPHPQSPICRHCCRMAASLAMACQTVQESMNDTPYPHCETPDEAYTAHGLRACKARKLHP